MVLPNTTELEDDVDAPMLRGGAELAPMMVLCGDPSNRRRLRLELRRGDVVVGQRELSDGMPDAEGRRALNRLMPVMADHSAIFLDHVLLVSFAGVLREFPDRGEAALRRIGARLVPRLKAVAGPGSSCVWVSPIHLLVFAPSENRDGFRDCPAACLEEMHVLLGEAGHRAMDHYLLRVIQPGRLEFEQLRDAELVEIGEDDPARRELSVNWKAFVAGGRKPSLDAYAVPGHIREALPEERPILVEEDAIPEVGTVYKPIWDLRNEVVTSSIALPARILHGHLALGLDAMPEAYADGQVLTEVVAGQLVTVGRDLAAMYAAGGAGFVSVGVPFDAVSNARRLGRIAVAAGAVPATARKGLLLGLTDVPPDVGDGKVQDILRTLRPLCRGVTLTVEAREPQWRRFLDQKLAALGLEAPHDGRHGDDISAIATRFAADCHAHRKRCFFGPVNDRAQVAALRQAKVDYVYGPAVAPVRMRPLPACTYPRADFESGNPPR